jgi:hypothetical protein
MADPFKAMEEMADRIKSMSKEDLARLRKKIAEEVKAKRERASKMKDTFTCCPAHGWPIAEIGLTKYDVFGTTFEFYNLECGRREYCNVDISDEEKLLKILDKRAPLSRDKPFSDRPEPDLEKAGIPIDEHCPYCGQKGGISYSYGYYSSWFFPKTLQRYKMSCGHDFAIIYNIS